ncbi:MAG: hypothetical protein IJX12_07335 [Lachnospiraceae bacterium]|nr:hypothetical protein [Lachnospiraceae bacterium]
MSNCCCNKRILSAAISNGLTQSDCIDICANPQCGDPEYLTLLAPVVYDELGINICRSIPLPETVATDFPTAVYASAEVIDIAFTVNPETGTGITIAPISGRANCYEIELSTLSVTFALKLYDCCNRLLTTLTLDEVIYLPPDATTEGYNEDTNPSSVVMELFAPYGVVYTDGDVTTPSINFIGFSTTNSSVEQGLNMLSIPKVLDFDLTGGSITIGLTIIVKSIYFTQYQIPHNGKAIVTKGSLTSEEESVCMDFVNGSLLDRNIKPLESCNPFDKKENCNSPDPTPCSNIESNACPLDCSIEDN